MSLMPTSRIVSKNISSNTTKQEDLSNVNDIINIPFFICIILLANTYITIVLSQKNLRTNIFNWLTINICLASILFCCENLLSSTLVLSNTSNAKISCHVKLFIVRMSAYRMMYAHCTTSFCRLLTIKYYHKQLFRSTHWILANISIDWIGGMISALPFLFFSGPSCLPYQFSRVFGVYNGLTIILIPLTIVTLCNLIIFRLVRLSGKRVHNVNNNIDNHRNKLNKRELHLFKVMLLTFLIYVIGTTPLILEKIFLIDEYNLSPFLITLFEILPSTALLANMILVIFTDQSVRDIFIKVSKCDGHFFYICR